MKTRIDQEFYGEFAWIHQFGPLETTRNIPQERVTKSVGTQRNEFPPYLLSQHPCRNLLDSANSSHASHRLGMARRISSRIYPQLANHTFFHSFRYLHQPIDGLWIAAVIRHETPALAYWIKSVCICLCEYFILSSVVMVFMAFNQKWIQSVGPGRKPINASGVPTSREKRHPENNRLRLAIREYARNTCIACLFVCASARTTIPAKR